MFDRDLIAGDPNTRYSAVRSIMRVSAKLRVPASTIERLSGLFADPNEAVRDIASKALLGLNAVEE